METVNLMECQEAIRQVSTQGVDVIALVREWTWTEGTEPPPEPRPWKCPIYTF